jgi:hypothetical protein
MRSIVACIDFFYVYNKIFNILHIITGNSKVMLGPGLNL